MRTSHAATARLTLASLLFLVTTGIVDVSRIAGASCVAPLLSADVTSASPGASVEIRGQYFGTDCNDVVVAGTTAGPPLGEPRTDIRLVIVQDGRVFRLLTANPVDAAADYAFVAQVTLPTQLHPGSATIRTDQGDSGALPFTITTSNVVNTTSTTTMSTTTPAATATSVPTLPAGVHKEPPAGAARDARSRIWPWISSVIGLGVASGAIAVLRSRTRTRKPAT